MAKFTISRRANGQYYFNLKADNGEIILSSEGYTSKTGCINGVEAVKFNAIYDSRYEKKISYNNKYYFILKAPNGQVIGISEMYESSYSRDNGILAVKRYAPPAIVFDISI